MSGALPIWEGLPELEVEMSEDERDEWPSLPPAAALIVEDHETNPVRRARSERAARRLSDAIKALLQGVPRA